MGLDKFGVLTVDGFVDYLLLERGNDSADVLWTGDRTRNAAGVRAFLFFYKNLLFAPRRIGTHGG